MKKNTSNSTYIKTIKVRIRDKHAPMLRNMSRSVNFVWNYINELSSRAIRERNLFLSAYDIQRYTSGSSKELGIHSGTINQVTEEYATRRKQFKKGKLNWRKSQGSRRSLGWIPFKKGAVKWKNGQVYHNGYYYKVWDSYGLSQYQFRAGSFNEDSRGRWYLNVAIQIEAKQSTGTQSVGIDLGCKEAAVDSNGEGVKGRRYRELEKALGKAQKARKKNRVKAIHAKIKNLRSNDLHQYSRKLVNNNAAIFVGNVSSQKLVKTKMAKSVLDAGWGQLKTMLEYKCAHAGVVFEEVDERNTTQTCSSCGGMPPERPRGIAGLGIREWQCSECGVTHDRDVNAAKNILAAGHRRLAVGIPSLK